MGIIGEMKRDKSSGMSGRSSASSDRGRPLSFWGGLGKSSPKSEPVPKGFKLKTSYGGSTGHLDAYGGAYGLGGMRPAVSMPVVAGPAPALAHHAGSSLSSKGAKRGPQRNSLPPLVAPPVRSTERPAPRAASRTVRPLFRPAPSHRASSVRAGDDDGRVERETNREAEGNDG